MNKAIKILKTLKSRAECYLKFQDFAPNLDEAIAEIEEAMKPKSCEDIYTICLKNLYKHKKTLKRGESNNNDYCIVDSLFLDFQTLSNCFEITYEKVKEDFLLANELSNNSKPKEQL